MNLLLVLTLLPKKSDTTVGDSGEMICEYRNHKHTELSIVKRLLPMVL